MLPHPTGLDDGARTTLARVTFPGANDSHPHRVTRDARTLASIEVGRVRSVVPRATPVMRIDLDMPVSCVDGAFGELADVIIDPSSRRLTHFVVAPHDQRHRARMVPTGSARAGDAEGFALEGLALDCTAATISASEPIQESAYLRTGELVEGGSDWDVGIQEAYPIPDGGSLGPEMMGSGMQLDIDQHVAVNYHRIPKGDVEIRRSSDVTSTDGHRLGHVVGFVIDDGDQITGLVLEHGHLWGKRMVQIPGRAIDRFEIDELVLALSGDEVGALKPLPGHHWGL
jgi:sporulation protein YlmC with PRC-barrel domain